MLDCLEGKDTHEQEDLCMNVCGNREETQEEQMGYDTRLIRALNERGTGEDISLRDSISELQ